jgi:hypothetical protein
MFWLGSTLGCQNKVLVRVRVNLPIGVRVIVKVLNMAIVSVRVRAKGNLPCGRPCADMTHV